MFNKEPLRIIDSIYDFIGDYTDDYIENYDEISNDISEGGPLLESCIISNLCEVITKYFECEKIIDIGCGFGNVLYNSYAKKKVGIDISFNQLRRVDGSIIKVRCNAEDIPIENEYFDFVICTDIFEHVLSIKNLVNEIDRLLVMNGSLLFATPWKQDISVYDTKEYQKKFKKRKYVHLRSIDDNVIEKNFGDRFKIINTTLITAAMKYMVFKPYPVKFIHFIKREM